MGGAVDPWMSLKSNAADASLKGAGIQRTRLPSSSPYSPECVEDEFSELRFALTEFSAVRRFFGALTCFGAMAHIHCPHTSVCCVRYVAQLTLREGVGLLPALNLDQG
jgi:hypothetical protein